MSRPCRAVCFALALVWLLGCGGAPPSAPQVAKVKGTVNIDGKPVPDGEVHFGGAGVPPKALEVKGGAFSGEAPVGNNKVEVFIYVEGPATEKYGGTRSKTNTVPRRYWGPNTTLAANVKAGDGNDFKFDITSK